MKFLETHYEEYIQSKDAHNLHPKLDKLFSKFPSSIFQLKNLIFYGPSGVGKYTQMLGAIRRYSASDLKYEKKISISFNKQQFFFKISDIHYEIDFALLGCNSKLLWHDIYTQIIDIISAKTEKAGIIVCKNFNEINRELLDNFYSYMQDTRSNINLIFIILTESISFIPNNILDCCELINVPRPTKTALSKCIKEKVPSKLTQIINIKTIQCGINELSCPWKIICDKLLVEMCNIDDLKFLKFRDMMYDIFIYNLDISDCIWYILTTLTTKGLLKQQHSSNILTKTYTFLQFYNNNYRPIYHLEGYLFYLITLIHNI